LKQGKLSPQEEKMLLRWLFIAHMRGHYSGSTETRLDGHLSLLYTGQSLSSLLDQLLLHGKTGKLELADVAGKSIGVRSSPCFTSTSSTKALRAFGKNEPYGVKNLKQTNEHPSRRNAS